MVINSVALQNFRNFATKEIVFPQAPLLVAAAPNATGKTNFLEAVVVLLRGKSWRATHDECARWGEESFAVSGTVEGKQGSSNLSVRYHMPSRALHIEEDGLPVSPVTFYSHYPLVLFLPEDTFMFHRGPATRRTFFNTSLVASSAYLSAVVQYHRVLRQRNAALKTAKDANDMSAWTELLVQHAEVIWAHRQTFVRYLSSYAGGVMRTLFEETREVTIDFISGAADTTRFRELMEEAWPYEQKYRYTLYGPHRDDLRVLIDGRPATSVLSRGQMRGLVISLKLATWGFIKQLSGQAPLLLLDEVLSELDEDRQGVLLASLPETQILLTCTKVPDQVRRRDGVHLLDLRAITSGTAPSLSPVAVVEESAEEAVAVRS